MALPDGPPPLDELLRHPYFKGLDMTYEKGTRAMTLKRHPKLSAPPPAAQASGITDPIGYNLARFQDATMVGSFSRACGNAKLHNGPEGLQSFVSIVVDTNGINQGVGNTGVEHWGFAISAGTMTIHDLACRESGYVLLNPKKAPLSLQAAVAALIRPT